MQNPTELVDRYVALWNEPDVDRRRQAIVALWTPDGLHYATNQTCHGYRALEDRVTRSYERSIAPGLNHFRHADNIEAHHNVVRFNWHMVRKADAHVVAVGFDLFVLADDGRIAADYQFIDRSE
jgi:hypothetical protein